MKIYRIRLLSLFATVAAVTLSCSNDSDEFRLNEPSHIIDVTVANSTNAIQTRQESDGIGLFSEYGLIAIEENTGMTLCDNLTMENGKASINTESWKNDGNAVIYFPRTGEIEYLEEKGRIMIPFDMDASGQTPQISAPCNIGAKTGDMTLELGTTKLTSIINLTIKEGNGKYDTGHLIINESTANGIATRGFYVLDTDNGNGHWENQKGHKKISLSNEAGNFQNVSFEAVPEKLGKQSISLKISTERFTFENQEVPATENAEFTVSLAEILGTDRLEPGTTYSAELVLNIEDFISEIEFTSSISDWNENINMDF
ncbi:MAG: hypothetical protein KBT49_03555 [Bacteroidetes bacterium]|nr:hypothetical protein [Candidatus Colenecus caballi]